MLLKQFRILNSALTFAQSEKNNYRDLYVAYHKYHFDCIASNKIKNFQDVVYYWYNGSLQLNRSSEFPSKISWQEVP